MTVVESTTRVVDPGVLQLEHLPQYYTAWRNRYAERDGRYDIMADVLAGNFDIFDPDEEKLEFRSPNYIRVALEDTAESAAILPTVRGHASKPGPKARDRAGKTERIAAGHLAASNFELQLPQIIYNLAAFGLSPYVVYPDPQQNLPTYEVRDPRTCYPEPGFRTGDSVRRCMFARELYYSQLPSEWQIKLLDFVNAAGQSYPSMELTTKVTLVEWFSDTEVVIAGMFHPGINSYDQDGVAQVNMVPVEFERMSNPAGTCQVVIGSRFTVDGQFRGQFDQSVDMLEAHGRLMALLLDYADQSVYSDLWVKDLVGELAYGGGAYIELGPNGAIGRVPPAVSSLNVASDLNMLQEGIHIDSRWPKTRPGDVDQSIASAKFVEATAGMMNTALKTYHMIVKHMIERALNIGLRLDAKVYPGQPKTVHGILRNQEFIEDYDSADIDLETRISVEYGLGLGRDPAQSAVLHLQYAQAGFVSNEFVQENIDGLTDVGRERQRIDIEQLRKVVMAKILQGTEQGSVSNRQLIEIVNGRIDGDDLWTIFEKIIVAPEEEAAQAGPAMPPGMPPQMAAMLGQGGGPPGAGSPPPAPGGPPPGGPPGAGPQPPPTPGPNQILNRLSVPAKGTGVLGSQVRS